ncbi:MAG: FMN-binding negative transcriptional regulator [Candidatus Eremiobacteraeota bacterium]|nr:FMN-binding negative transcriptional regulator [Candidatus Eremiobacteraeota bacterium]
MYVPPAFSVDDRAWALELIERYPFGILVTCDREYPFVTHLPMVAYERDGRTWIAGHVARANPHEGAVEARTAATAIFSGVHAFVSASWYAQPYETVPTWNYTAVHASGRLCDADPRDVLARLVARFEGEASGAWRLEGLRAAYLDNQLRGIRAFEFSVDRWDVKAKLSQNRTAEDRARVERALAASSRPLDRDCASEMRAFEDGARA